MPDWRQPAQSVNAEDTHNAAMSMLAGYVKVTTTKDLMGVLGY
jgi:hypothetical protein